MSQYQYKDLIVEVLNEPGYESGVDNNAFNYSKEHFASMAYDFPTSKHGVKIFQDGKLISDCIIIGYGGKTDVSQNSALIDDDVLLICCCNSVFCLTLTELELVWKTEADFASCFQIFKHKDNYLVHGELQVTQLDRDGYINWEFKEVGILMSLDGEEVFKIESDWIELTNLDGTKYKIDFDGNSM